MLLAPRTQGMAAATVNMEAGTIVVGHHDGNSMITVFRRALLVLTRHIYHTYMHTYMRLLAAAVVYQFSAIV